jgi:hypothetical protein
MAVRTWDHRDPVLPRWRTALLSGLVLGALALVAPASARPEKIRAGASYYSDELVETGSVRDIGAERNYEEVYQFYTYYEVFYDENERVVRSLEYERGEVIREDTYRYSNDGSLLEHTVKVPGETAKSVPIPSAD